MSDLLCQETTSVSCALRILFRMLNDADRVNVASEVEDKLLE